MKRQKITKIKWHQSFFFIDGHKNTNLDAWKWRHEKTLIAQEEYNSNVNGGGEKVLPLQNPKFWYVRFKPSIPNHLWLRWHQATYDDGTLSRRKLTNNFVFSFFFPHLPFATLHHTNSKHMISHFNPCLLQ